MKYISHSNDCDTIRATIRLPSCCQDRTYYVHSLAHVMTLYLRMNFDRSLGAHEQILGNVMYRPLLKFWNSLVGCLMAAFTGLKALLKLYNHLKPFMLILTALKHYWRITDIEYLILWFNQDLPIDEKIGF
jgi:hypothetical protein